MTGRKASRSSSPVRPASDLPEGVEIRGDSIRIAFAYRGVRCRETLHGLEPSKQNIRYADNLRRIILHEIATNTFDYLARFPDSARAQKLLGPGRTGRTVAEVLDQWLSIKQGVVAHSTYTHYKRKAELHVRPLWGDVLIGDITTTAIEVWRHTDLNHLANKTINEIMIVFRGVLEHARKARIIQENPMMDVDNLAIHQDEADPFTRDEIDRITQATTTRHSELAMMTFNMWSGLRLSELMALAWEDVDLKRGIVKVRRACVMGKYKVPKTRGSVREVELIAPALAILAEQRARTEMQPARSVEVTMGDNKTIRTERLRFIFLNSNTSKPFMSDMQVRDRFWSTLLRAIGVRYRGPNNARHTFASQMLTAGMPKEWIARQMGHTSTRMIERHYGKWIREDAPDMAAIASARLGFAPPSRVHSQGHKAG